MLINKYIRILKMPRIFIITLKRFDAKEKLNNFVDFPLKGLDMSPYVIDGGKDLIYDCFAISNHIGS